MRFSSHTNQFGVTRKFAFLFARDYATRGLLHVESYCSVREELLPGRMRAVESHLRTTVTRFATTDPRNIAVPTRTTRGPGGTPVTFAREIPAKALIAPNAAPRSPYRARLPLTFFAAAAGRMTRAPTRRVPTTLIPVATTTATRKR